MARKTAPNCAAPALDALQLEAAQLVAEGELTEKAIAEKVERSRRTIQAWKKLPAFQAKVKEVVALLDEALLERGIARRARRVARLDATWEALQTIVRERGQDPDHQALPGGATGYQLRRVKMIGGGDNAEKVIESELDAAILRALLDLERQAAQELGQWIQKLAPTDPTGEEEWQGGLSDRERLEALRALYARLGTGDREAPPDGAAAPQ